MKTFSLLMLCGICLLALLVRPAQAVITCETTSISPGPPLTVQFTIQETSILGIKRISVTESLNATVSVPIFPQGTTEHLIVTASQVMPAGGIRVALEIENTAGSKKTCGYSDQVPDTQAPVCDVSLVSSGPPLKVEFSIRDNESGIKEIQILQSLNASISVPPISDGAKGPITVTASETTASDMMQVEIRVTDVAGNSKTCGYAEAPSIDITAPSCTLVAQDQGPPGILKVEFQDLESGLHTVNVLQANNANVTFPSFVPGTTGTVVATITQIISELDFNVRLEAVDLEGNSQACSFSTSVFQHARPEFDAVGTDSANFFNDIFKSLIAQNGKDGSGKKINDFSSFTSEYFFHTSSEMIPDPCYSVSNQTYLSAFTPSYTDGSYEWQVVLQMKPSADIFVQIVGCVLRGGENDVWKHARQTGRYRVPWDPTQAYFNPGTNPQLTVKALPGPNSKKGFPAEGFYLDARSAPGLEGKPLMHGLISLQAFIEQGVLVILPRTGLANSLGQTMYELSAGDRLRITLALPFNSTADIYLGSDSLVLKYVGIVGTEFTLLD